MFTTFLFATQLERDSLKKMPGSSLHLPLGTALNGMPSLLCDRQVVGASNLLVALDLSH